MQSWFYIQGGKEKLIGMQTNVPLFFHGANYKQKYTHSTS